MNHELPDVQAGLKKGRRTKIKLPTSLDHRKSKRIPEEHLLMLYDYPKAFDCVDHKKLWKIFQDTGKAEHLTCFLRNLYVDQEATVRTRHGIIDWSQVGKGVPQSYLLSPAYLTYLQSASCEMPGWMKHKLESGFPGEISTASDMQMISL